MNVASAKQEIYEYNNNNSCRYHLEQFHNGDFRVPKSLSLALAPPPFHYKTALLALASKRENDMRAEMMETHNQTHKIGCNHLCFVVCRVFFLLYIHFAFSQRRSTPHRQAFGDANFRRNGESNRSKSDRH